MGRHMQKTCTFIATAGQKTPLMTCFRKLSSDGGISQAAEKIARRNAAKLLKLDETPKSA